MLSSCFQFAVYSIYHSRLTLLLFSPSRLSFTRFALLICFLCPVPPSYHFTSWQSYFISHSTLIHYYLPSLSLSLHLLLIDSSSLSSYLLTNDDTLILLFGFSLLRVGYHFIFHGSVLPNFPLLEAMFFFMYLLASSLLLYVKQKNKQTCIIVVFLSPTWHKSLIFTSLFFLPPFFHHAFIFSPFLLSSLSVVFLSSPLLTPFLSLVVRRKSPLQYQR